MLRVLVGGAVLLGAIVGSAAPLVTIYSGGFGYIVETRSVEVAHEGDLVLDGLPLTLILDSLVVDGLAVTRIEPRPRAVLGLEGWVGTVVTVFAHGERFQGRLVAVSRGISLLTEDGLVFLPSYDRIVAPLPVETLSADRLALNVRYRDAHPGQAEIRVRYLAEGLSWSVAYAATLDGENLRLRGLATLVNTTGVAFVGAKLALVAGDVYRPTAKGDGPGVRALAALPEADVAPAFEYHRYAFPSPVDLTRGTALVPLLEGELRYRRAYRFSGGPVEVRVRFTNTLGPLPAGEVRFYEGDLFLGAAAVGHTPLGAAVDLGVGAAFDLRGERVLEARERLGEGFYRDTYRIRLRSAKAAPAEVEVVETLPGTWTITRSTLPYERLDAQRVLFRMAVPAGGEAEVLYTAEWRY